MTLLVPVVAVVRMERMNIAYFLMVCVCACVFFDDSSSDGDRWVSCGGGSDGGD